MTKYKNAMADLNEHSKSNYHMISSQRAKDFLTNYENGDETAINVLLSNQKREIIEHNRKRLIPIIKTILFAHVITYHRVIFERPVHLNLLMYVKIVYQKIKEFSELYYFFARNLVIKI
jgi:hypothetical protein